MVIWQWLRSSGHCRARDRLSIIIVNLHTWGMRVADIVLWLLRYLKRQLRLKMNDFAA